MVITPNPPPMQSFISDERQELLADYFCVVAADEAIAATMCRSLRALDIPIGMESRKDLRLNGHPVT